MDCKLVYPVYEYFAFFLQHPLNEGSPREEKIQRMRWRSVRAKPDYKYL